MFEKNEKQQLFELKYTESYLSLRARARGRVTGFYERRIFPRLMDLGLRSLGRLKVRRRWAMVVRGVWEWRDEAGLVSS